MVKKGRFTVKTYVSGCLVCGKSLNYHFNERRIKCEICRTESETTVTCEDGHYVCDECHAKDGYNCITNHCLTSAQKNPIAIATDLMKNNSIKMHGPEHHYLVAAALLTAFKNVGGQIDLNKALTLALQRASNVPGGICGMWGSCGAGIGAGIFVSVVTGATPLSKKEWSLANLMTSQALKDISENGGPRCCKRNTYLAILRAIKFAEEYFSIHMEEQTGLTCAFSHRNTTCRKYDCLFYPSHPKQG